MREIRNCLQIKNLLSAICKLIDEEKYLIILMKFPFNQFTLFDKEMGEKLSKGPSSQENEQIWRS